MVFEKIYNFERNKYNLNGFHKNKILCLFIDFIKECEEDFFDEFDPYFANAFYANSSVLFLLKSCFCTEDNEIFGMESKDGEIDIEMNMEMEEFSENKTIYSLSSSIKGKEDEHLHMIIDNIYSDSQFALKYVPEDEEDDENMEFITDPECKLSLLV
ncbi:MAG TPA: hypothetical protein PK294_00595 [Ignavibacteria bacterium]|nr:hypothetical protein [Ignavibacteria bacterium]